ncbi:Uncharacterised protein [Segatella copri]|nr:Uncharacterised protein [Segatella copri]
MRCNRIAILIFSNHVSLVASISRISQTGTKNRIAHISHKLLIF